MYCGNMSDSRLKPVLDVMRFNDACSLVEYVAKHGIKKEDIQAITYSSGDDTHCLFYWGIDF